MNLLPLMMGWGSVGLYPQLQALRDAPGDNAPLISRVLRRDRFTCRFCGFASRPSVEVPHGYMHAVPASGDLKELSEQRWVTVDSVCLAHLHSVDAVSSGQFHMIAAPWIEASDLSVISKVLLSVLHDSTHLYFGDCVRLHDHLLRCESGTAAIVRTLPRSAATPRENIRRWLTVLQGSILPEQYRERALFLHPFRLLPDRSALRAEAIYWHHAAIKNYPISRWERMASWTPEAKSAS